MPSSYKVRLIPVKFLQQHSLEWAVFWMCSAIILGSIVHIVAHC